MRQTLIFDENIRWYFRANIIKTMFYNAPAFYTTKLLICCNTHTHTCVILRKMIKTYHYYFRIIKCDNKKYKLLGSLFFRHNNDLHNLYFFFLFPVFWLLLALFHIRVTNNASYNSRERANLNIILCDNIWKAEKYF